VREAYGLLQHHRARTAWIVCCGEFTADAKAFVRDKPIALLSGMDLLDAINEIRSGRPASASTSEQRPSATAEERACPRCSSPMVKRTNRRTGAQA
jgi:restriction system protein